MGCNKKLEPCPCCGELTPTDEVKCDYCGCTINKKEEEEDIYPLDKNGDMDIRHPVWEE